MARTIRRKHYTPAWVTEKSLYIHNPATGYGKYAGYTQMEGAERAKQLRWWHEDKGRGWGARPSKSYRQEVEMQHRAAARTELVRWLQDTEYEVLVLSRPQIGYWD